LGGEAGKRAETREKEETKRIAVVKKTQGEGSAVFGIQMKQRHFLQKLYAERALSYIKTGDGKKSRNKGNDEAVGEEGKEGWSG